MTKLSVSMRLSVGAAAASLILISGTGCGNWASAGYNHSANPTTSQNQSISYTNPGSNGGFPNDTADTCPDPSALETTGGATGYTVCQNSTSGFSISIHTQGSMPTNVQTLVVVFPVDTLGSSEYAVNYNSSGGVLSQTIDISSGTAFLQFTTAKFNAAFVVSPQNASDMAWCLQYNFDTCPAYSYDRFNAYDSSTSTN